MIPVVVRRSGIPPEEKCNTITREQRAVLLDVLKHFTVEISGFAPLSGAIVTAGGVSVKEVDPKTMQSKLIPGLYFAGKFWTWTRTRAALTCRSPLQRDTRRARICKLSLYIRKLYYVCNSD